MIGQVTNRVTRWGRVTPENAVYRLQTSDMRSIFVPPLLQVDGFGGAPKDAKLSLGLVESLADSADSNGDDMISFDEFKGAFN